MTNIKNQMKRTKLFLDTEFTGLHKDTTLLSIGLISECGKMFYAELTDYDKNQIDEWLQTNVLDKFVLKYLNSDIEHSGVTDETELDFIKFKGTRTHLKVELERWLSQFEAVEIWSDCLAYDWVLFCDIFGHAFNVPKNVYYIPFDICTVFKMKGINPDISRAEFIGVTYPDNYGQHNALVDAKVIRNCYNKLMENE